MEINEESKNELRYKECVKCGNLIKYSDSDTYWDYSMMGYDAKLIKCPHCRTHNVLEYEENSWMKNF